MKKGKGTLLVLLSSALVLSSVPASVSVYGAQPFEEALLFGAGEDTGNTEGTGTGGTEVQEPQEPETPQEPEEPEKPVVKIGLKKENGKYYFYVNGKKVKRTWKKINGKRYYFTSKYHAATGCFKVNGKLYVFRINGQLFTPSKPSIINVGSASYYVNKSGIASTGWLTIGNKLYYAGTAGKLMKNRTYQGITFTKNGAAKNDTAAQLKLKTMSIVSSITNSSMSKSQKLRACWNYVVGGNIYYSSYYPNLSKSGWQKETALRTLTTRGGNCYGFACAFAALAYEVGYDPYLVCGRVSGSRDHAADGLTRHCWVRINGLYYDPEAQYAGWYPGVYGYSGYYMYHTIQQFVRFR